VGLSAPGDLDMSGDPASIQPEAESAGHSGEKEAALFLFLRREEGQGLAEYALILALIALLAIAALLFFSNALQTQLSVIGEKL
jgi:Flp pilus assembly pilin Flp